MGQDPLRRAGRRGDDRGMPTPWYAAPLTSSPGRRATASRTVAIPRGVADGVLRQSAAPNAGRGHRRGPAGGTDRLTDLLVRDRHEVTIVALEVPHVAGSAERCRTKVTSGSRASVQAHLLALKVAPLMTWPSTAGTKAGSRKSGSPALGRSQSHDGAGRGLDTHRARWPPPESAVPAGDSRRLAASPARRHRRGSALGHRGAHRHREPALLSCRDGRTVVEVRTRTPLRVRSSASSPGRRPDSPMIPAKAGRAAWSVTGAGCSGAVATAAAHSAGMVASRRELVGATGIHPPGAVPTRRSATASPTRPDVAADGRSAVTDPPGRGRSARQRSSSSAVRSRRPSCAVGTPIRVARGRGEVPARDPDRGQKSLSERRVRRLHPDRGESTLGTNREHGLGADVDPMTGHLREPQFGRRGQNPPRTP